jgi:tetratricopeptide (TPR) repeat protein
MYMKKIYLLSSLLFSLLTYAQHDHHHDNDTTVHSHLAHIQAARSQVFYIHNLPPPKIMDGVGNSKMTIQTKSDKTQQYFNQGLSLLHDFWDFEAYRAFKEAIRNDTAAIMPYWGLLQTVGTMEDSVYKADRGIAIKRLKDLKGKAPEHERLYAEYAIIKDSLKNKEDKESAKKLEQIVHKFPDDIDAKLFLAIKKAGFYDTDLNPGEGQLYAEYLIKDVLKTNPQSHAAHHYWIHMMENCCPEQAVASADILASLAPKSGHIVHMPGHIYNRLGDYKKAHDAFVTALKVDSAYMKEEGIQEVDDWNYIHNINYLIANCAQDGRHTEGLYYAEKLKNMPVTKDRKKIYEGIFFYQGILAPAKMEMAFSYWDKATVQLDSIQDKDTIYNISGMNYKNGLMLYVKGMNTVAKNDSANAVKYSDALDAFLWRNENQSSKDSVLDKWLQNTLNASSLELQGCVKSLQGDYDMAVKFLDQAATKEKELGYGEPPLYTRPVAMSLAQAHERAGKWDKAIEAYETILRRFPNSAYAYRGLVNVYREKGDEEKAKEYEGKLKEVTKYGDKDVYALTKQAN